MNYLGKVAVCLSCYNYVTSRNSIRTYDYSRCISFDADGIYVNGNHAYTWEQVTPSSIYSLASDLFNYSNTNVVIGLSLSILNSLSPLRDITSKFLAPFGVELYEWTFNGNRKLIAKYGDCFVTSDLVITELMKHVYAQSAYVSITDSGLHVYEDGDDSNYGAYVVVDRDLSHEDIRNLLVYEYPQEQVLWCRKYAPNDLKDLDDNELCAAMDYIYHQLAARKD